MKDEVIEFDILNGNFDKEKGSDPLSNAEVPPLSNDKLSPVFKGKSVSGAQNKLNESSEFDLDNY